MSRREPKGKKASDTEVISWKQKKDLADMEEMAVGEQLEELTAWTAMIEAMGDEQLKDYALNRPESLRSIKTGKNAPGKKKKDLANIERKQLEELTAWTAMSVEELKDYALNRPESLWGARTGKNTPEKKQGRRGGKSCSSSRGLMAVVWKYHKDDDDGASVS